ncbi:DUF998 domain-containing protein [Pseudonocardia spinosispora]|uniref:DUF998 domain-containing protein n=1 Tax=Pseudonocardia spinosispora TaxID=103441 RepID=UPI0007E8D608|nr:DUF998 domain-containing protein [Pseudonocardia spinosispora]
MPISPASRTETPDADVARRAMIGRAVPVIGTSLVSLGLLLIVLLHVLPPSSSVSPLSRTISEYALGANRWLFDVAVVALAVGSIAILLGLVRARLLRPLGTASLLIGVWAVCLVLLVVFQKYDYQNGQSTGPAGMIHRMSSLAAFLSLPTGALLIARRSRIRPAIWTRRAALACWLFLSVLFYAVAQSFVTGIAWWRVFPLGAMERLIGISELAVLFALGCWAIVASPPAKAGD